MITIKGTTNPPQLCECPDGLVIDEDINECVLPSNCTPSKWQSKSYNLCSMASLDEIAEQ